jgi:drug/metabolite transporter (DMT)-like permease
MLALGSLLATVSGMLYVTAAILEKREGMMVLATHRGWRLLAVLVRRPAWLLAIGISAVAWVAEAASLALAPVATVATLRNAGRGLLVVGGGRWLNERFSRWELVGVALAAAGGAVTAIAGVDTSVSRRTLSNLDQLTSGAGCALVAAVIAWAGSACGRRAVDGPGNGRRKKTGVLLGAAVGVLFTGTGIFTKEIADRVAVEGAGSVGLIVLSPAPWMMLLMGAGAQNLLQEGFRRANVAAVSSAAAATASLGLIAAGFALYGERVVHTAFVVALSVGAAVSLLGTALLVFFRPATAEITG